MKSKKFPDFGHGLLALRSGLVATELGNAVEISSFIFHSMVFLLYRSQLFHNRISQSRF